MTPHHASSRFTVIDDDSVALAPRNSRRIFYLAIFLILAGSLFFGFDPAVDLSGSRIVGTIGVAMLMVAVLVVAGVATRTVFNRSGPSIATQRTIFSVRVSSSERPLPRGTTIVAQDVELMKRPERNDRSSSLLAGFLTARTHLYRLFVDTGEERIKIEEATYPGEIEDVGKALADFLGIPFQTESI
jgi:hypothetical protein